MAEDERLGKRIGEHLSPIILGRKKRQQEIDVFQLNPPVKNFLRLPKSTHAHISACASAHVHMQGKKPAFH